VFSAGQLRLVFSKVIKNFDVLNMDFSNRDGFGKRPSTFIGKTIKN